MKLSLNNFLYGIKQIVMGGGRNTDNSPKNDSGFLKKDEGVTLSGVTPALVNSTGGTPSMTLAAGAGVTTLSIPIQLAAMTTAAADLITNYTPGYAFKVLSVSFVTTTLGTGAAASQTLNLEIGTTNLTGGVVNVTLASTDTLGEITAGTAVTAANVGTAADTISLEVAAGGTVFTAGAGVLLVKIQNMDTANAIASLAAQFAGTADETSARVLQVDANVDTVGTWAIHIPMDYDEATDILKVRVLASQVTVSTDNDVQLDAEVYRKRAGSALTADLFGTLPSTVLSTTEQWVEFSLIGQGFQRDDMVYFKLLTDGHNDTAGEEVLVHGIEVRVRSTFVSYDETDGASNAVGNSLR